MHQLPLYTPVSIHLIPPLELMDEENKNREKQLGINLLRPAPLSRDKVA
jgi:hypothetical protein